MDDLNVVCGPFEVLNQRSGAIDSLKYIIKDFNNIKESYFRLGFHLNEFIMFEYYKDFGYVSFKDFAINNISIEYSQLMRCISVFRMTAFCNKGSTVKTMFIDEKYEKYSYSQLVEMLPLDKEKRSKVTPDMSVRQIRDLKKKNCDVAITNVETKLIDNNVITEKNVNLPFSNTIDLNHIISLLEKIKEMKTKEDSDSIISSLIKYIGRFNHV